MTGLSRRGVLRGLLAAPMIVRTPGLLMPVRSFELRYNAEGLAWLQVEMQRQIAVAMQIPERYLFYTPTEADIGRMITFGVGGWRVV